MVQVQCVKANALDSRRKNGLTPELEAMLYIIITTPVTKDEAELFEGLQDGTYRLMPEHLK